MKINVRAWILNPNFPRTKESSLICFGWLNKAFETVHISCLSGITLLQRTRKLADALSDKNVLSLEWGKSCSFLLLLAPSLPHTSVTNRGALLVSLHRPLPPPLKRSRRACSCFHTLYAKEGSDQSPSSSH
jgi:hypothetical protein